MATENNTETYNIKQLKEILSICTSYKTEEEDRECKRQYIDELKEIRAIKKQGLLVKAWHELIDSSIFHDAMGKVDEDSVTDESVTVLTVY